MASENGITTIRLLRLVSLPEILATIDEVARSGVCRRRIWLVPAGFTYTTSEIQTIADRGRKHWSTDSRVAYIACDDLSYGVLRMFEVYREQDNYETRVFRDEEEARSWLEEAPHL